MAASFVSSARALRAGEAGRHERVLFGRQAALVAVALLGLIVRPPLSRPVLAFSLLGLVGIVNLLSYTLNRRGRYSRRLEAFQILLDAAAITTLAALSGGLGSPLVVLFLAGILAAAVSLSMLGCWIATASALAGLTVVLLADPGPVEGDLLLIHAVTIMGTGWLVMRLIDRLRGRLQFRAAAAAHEIKNAVHSTAGLIDEALASLPAGGTGRHRLEAAAESLGGLSSLAQGLYRGSGVASKWVALESMVDDALLLAGPALRHAAIRVEVEAPARPVRLRVDPEAIRHCLLNLMLNAANHSQPGTMVRVRFKRSMLSTGLTMESRMRTDAAAVDSVEGWGVGLRVVRSLLAPQRGAIESRIEPDGVVRVNLSWSRWPLAHVSHDFPEYPSGGAAGERNAASAVVNTP